MIHILYTVILGLALFAILKASWYFIRLATHKKKYFSYFSKGFPIFGMIVWIFYAFFVAEAFFSNSTVYPVIVATMSIVLILAISWFVFRDVFAGVMLKSETIFKPGQFIRTDIISGTILSLGFTSVELQTGTGELVRIPYSRLRKQNILREMEKGHGKTQTITLKVPQSHTAHNIQKILKSKLLELPWVIAGSDISISMIPEENCFTTKITYESIYEDMLSRTEEIMNKIVIENFSQC
jgi:small-conductance mechanosensitive channel